MAQRKPRPKVVFISSTSEDLKEHRAAARDAANSAGFLPVMMEYFVASGKKPPLDAYLAEVDEADVRWREGGVACRMELSGEEV